MDATFNWTIKGGWFCNYRTSLYGILFQSQICPVTADDEKPEAWAYVAQWGNDDTGNGSRMYPFRTISKGISTLGYNQNLVIGTGIYKEDITPSYTNIFGDGNVLIDTTFCTGEIGLGRVSYNLTLFKGDGAYGGGLYTEYLGAFKNVRFLGDYDLSTASQKVYDSCFLYGAKVSFGEGVSFSSGIINCTLVECLRITIDGDLSARLIANNIFYRCNIWFKSGYPNVRNNLFFECNYRIDTEANDMPTVVFPSIPDGYEQFENIMALKTAYELYYLGVTKFTNNYQQDPLFNNIARSDYSIQVGAPSMNMAHDGTNVGAYSFSKTLYPTSEDDNGVLVDSLLNFDINNQGLEQIDNTQNSEAVFLPLPNIESRQLKSFNVGYENAPCSGCYVDTTDDLDATVLLSGDILEVNQPYFVKQGTAVYDGATYLTGQRFTTNSETTVTLNEDDELQRIIEAPSRWNILARLSNGSGILPSDYSIISGAWYYVKNGTINYDGVSYPTKSFFKGTAETDFNGVGELIEAFTNESYHLFEIDKHPSTNNVGNTQAGDIIRGNGHPDFDRTPSNVFSLYNKFIQFKVQVKANNLRNI